MRVLVFSDVHEQKNIVSKIVANYQPDAIFFLGDGIEVVESELKDLKPENIFMVKGNCDTNSNLSTNLIVTLEDNRILLTHGHGFHVKNGLMELFEYAKKESVNLVCFGHTHIAFNESINDIKFFNPGNLSQNNLYENSVGILEIDRGKITQKIEKI